MTIKYKDSKRIVGLSYTAGSEVGETNGTSESKTLGVTSSRYRGGIKIATGSALIGQTLSPTKGIKFELKRTGLSGVHSLSRFEIWNDETIISSATVTFQPDTKVGTSYAYVEFFPASTVTLQANYRITIATDGGVTNYYTFRSNASGTYDTTKTHWTESTYNAGSGGTWADDTGIDGNFKFTLADVGDVKPTNVQDNSIMVEKDTARRYWFSAGTAISFEDDYTSNTGWTQTGSKVTVDSGKSDWVDANAAATNDSLQQVIKSLGITLSDTAWTADFTYINNGGTVGGYPFVFQSGTGNYDSASNDAITMSEDNPNKIKINTKNGGTYVAGSSTIAVSSGTTYYIRIQRTSATDIKLSAFTDSARTTHTSGSPVTASNAGIANITGLTYVQHQNQTTGGGGTSNFEITDLKIYNNSTSAPTTATWTREGALDKTGLKAYWRFNETSGNIINQAEAIGSTDSADNTTGAGGSDLTTSGTTYNVSKSPMNYSLQFDGSNDYAKAGTSTSAWNFMHSTTAKWTLCFWADMTNNGSGTVMSTSATNNANVGIQIMSTSTGGIFRARVTDAGTVVTQLTTTNGVIPQDNKMHFYKLTYDQSLSSDNMKLSVDNGTNITQTKTSNAPTDGNAFQAMYIGMSDSTNFPMAGEFAEMSIWNRVLTDAEVTKIYNSGSGVFPLF